MSDENEEHQQSIYPLAAMISYESSSATAYGLIRNSIQNASKLLQPDCYKSNGTANRSSEGAAAGN